MNSLIIPYISSNNKKCNFILKDSTNEVVGYHNFCIDKIPTCSNTEYTSYYLSLINGIKMAERIGMKDIIIYIDNIDVVRQIKSQKTVTNIFDKNCIKEFKKIIKMIPIRVLKTGKLSS